MEPVLRAVTGNPLIRHLDYYSAKSGEGNDYRAGMSILLGMFGAVDTRCRLRLSPSKQLVRVTYMIYSVQRLWE